MGIQYRHTLIAVPKDFVPSAENLQRFLRRTFDLQAVPVGASLVLRKPSGKTLEIPGRVGLDPNTGALLVMEKRAIDIKDCQPIATIDELAVNIARLQDYEVEIAGFGIPKAPPLQISFADAYHLAITAFVSSVPRSTSDLHEQSPGKMLSVPYGNPCDAQAMANIGYFSHPHTLEVIEVEDAGTARFWIQFELGKFLVPDIANGDLNILNPLIVDAARDAFGIRFVQGCYWG